MAGRIFVSSTCYDLLDLRAEVEQRLRELGLVPVLSDRPSSDFALDPTADSIETCLVNVRASDAFVCIVSQRYGRSLKSGGYPDISATHLEWQEAKTIGKPIYFYARDRTLAEHSIWRANRGLPPKFAWVKDATLFPFIEEHSALVRAAGASNWLWPFRDSVELKQRLADDLGGLSRPALLRSLLAQGLLPIITADLRRRNGGGSGQDVAFDTGFFNRSDQGAFNVQVLIDGTQIALGDLAPGGEQAKSFKSRTEPNQKRLEKPFTLEYQTQRGHVVQDDFVLRYDVDGPGVGVTIDHVAKRLTGGPRFRIE
jgi:hypothetical protein